MTNYCKKAVLAASVAAVAFAATPALASPTSVAADGTATVKIYSPLTISAPTATDAVVDFGVLVGTLGGANARSSHNFVIDAATSPTAATVCTGAVNWSCSGAPHRAKYGITGAVNSSVNVNFSANTVSLVRSGGSSANPNDVVTLALNMSATNDSNGDGTNDVLLTAGAATVYVGGSLGVTDTNADGVYSGSFVINADYQ